MKQKNLVLMVVAVGCGLVAALLTSQMSAKTPAVDTVEVLVAAKDLPLGQMLGKDDLAGEKAVVKRKRMPKSMVPTEIVETEQELLDKRLTRGIRAEETINKGDLTKGGVVVIPSGKNLVTLPLDVSRAAAGFAGPGTKVDILTYVRLGEKVNTMPILVNMPVLAVDGQTAFPPTGVFPNVSSVSFAADLKQSLILELAKARGCQMSLLLRNQDDKETENDKTFDMNRVIEMLQDDKNPAVFDFTNGGREGTPRPKPESKGAVPKTVESTDPVPAPVAKAETVKVPYALVPIKEGTEITTDLIADEKTFGVRELPKDVAEDAVTDLQPLVGQVLRSGLGKGQWVTKSLVGAAELKPSPRDGDALTPPKPGDATPPAPATAARPAAGRKTHDLTLHTANGYEVFRYEEVKAGQWKLLGKVRPEGQSEPDAGKAPAADKNVD